MKDFTKNKIKAIIFDWGRTLHDPESDSLYPGVRDIVMALSKNYGLALVSLAKSDSPEGRRKKIGESGIAEYFKTILVGVEDKDNLYEEALTNLKATPQEVVIVDDRVIRGIAWGNRRGAVTIWIRQGRFADELPSTQTGSPTFTINDLKEIESLALGGFKMLK